MESKTVVDALEIINKLDAFYNNAWNHLLIFVTILVTLVGVVIPLGIQWYQRKTFKLDEERLHTTIRTEVEKARADLKAKLSEQIESEKEKLQEELRRLTKDIAVNIHQVRGGVFMDQGANQLLTHKDFTTAFISYISAIESFVLGNDHLNLRRALNTVVQNVLPKLSKEELERSKEPLSEDFEKALEMVKNKDVENAYGDLIKSLRYEWRKVQDRKQGP